MSLIALLTEGKTEQIFFSHLLPSIQLPDTLFFSNNLIKVLDNNTHKNKIWLQECHGDNSIPSFIKRNSNTFLNNEFDKIILIRDYFPAYRPPTNLCKANLCINLLNNIPAPIISKYSNNIFINLSVEEIEAWFFADKDMFQRMNHTLTEAYLNEKYNNILAINPEDIRHPSAKLKNIIEREIPNHRYNKTEKEIHFVISHIDINACLEVIGRNYVQSFHRIVNYLLEIL
jgi:hypothetical protein